MNFKPNILFIDDDKNVLRSLKRLLRKKKWELFFADSGNKGLNILSKKRVHLVVADIRMPEMNGFQLFNEIRENYPNTTRIILSGYAEQDSVTKALTNKIAQDIIFKPWDDKELIKSIKKALKFGSNKSDQISQVRKVINSMSELPGNIMEIIAELQQNEEINIEKISDLISQDPTISAQLLNWANSSIFGQASKVVSVERAAVLIGLDMLKGMLMSIGASESLPKFAETKDFNQNCFNLHQRSCATVARHLITVTFKDKQLAEKAFTGGLLHDIGKIVQAGFLQETFSSIIDNAVNHKTTYRQAEKRLNKLNHAKIGYFLAEWWNLPNFLCSVIRFHHNPGKNKRGNSEIVSAVHVADALVGKFRIGGSGNFADHKVDRKSWAMFHLNKKKLDKIKELLNETDTN